MDLVESSERMNNYKKGVKNGWNAMSAWYQSECVISVEQVHYSPFALGEDVFKLLGNVSDKEILELGCGAAHNAIALALNGAHVIAVDFSEQQLKHARDLKARENISVSLLQADIESLTFIRDKSFDIILSVFALEFVPNISLFMEECYRVLKPGGLLVVSTTHPLSAFEWINPENALVVDDYFNPPVELWQEDVQTGKERGITFFRTMEELFKSMSTPGFRIDKLLEPIAVSREDIPKSPYRGPYWDTHWERFSLIPFALLLRGVKPN